jgi:uncharacterized protein
MLSNTAQPDPREERMASSDQAEARPDERHSGAQLVFFLCFTEPAGVSAEEMRPHLDAHKRWIVEQERTGRLLAGGPLLDENYRFSGHGLFVLRAGSRAEAAEIADSDPFHANGIRTYRLQPWQLNEGNLQITLTMSDGAFQFS